MNDLFHRFAHRTATVVGSPWVFILATVAVVAWAVLGPVFGFSDAWQLTINTATTIVTFLMVFIIQNTQNRDAKAIQLKLDELIRGVSGARTGLVALEELTDDELDRLEAEFRRLRQQEKRKRREKAEAAGPGRDDARPAA